MAQPKKPKMALFKPDWRPIEGLQKGFQLGSHGSVWKGAKGWWASRKGEENIQRFKGPNQAKAWVEEPLRIAHEARMAKVAARHEERSARAEEKALRTWGDVTPEDRVLQPGQVWALKDPAYPDRQLLVLGVRKDTVVALTRVDGTPWSGCKRDVRSIESVPRLYRLVGREDLAVAGVADPARAAGKAQA